MRGRARPLDEVAACCWWIYNTHRGAVVSSDEASATYIRELVCRRVAYLRLLLEPGTFKNARYQVRRLRKHMPGVPVMALFWGLAGDNSRYLDGIEATECDIVTTGLKETVQHILAFARRSGTAARPSYQAAKLVIRRTMACCWPPRRRAKRRKRLHGC